MVFVSHDGENFFEKKIACVSTFFEKVFEKTQFLRVTTYLFENFFEKRPLLRMISIGGMRDQVEWGHEGREPELYTEERQQRLKQNS